MENGTKVVSYKRMGSGTGIFKKCGYEEVHFSTLPIGHPFSSLLLHNFFNKTLTITHTPLFY